MERRATVELGLIVERREIGHPWQRYRWRPVEVMVQAPPADGWRKLVEQPGLVRWHVGTLPLTLYRGETAAYRENLSSRQPAVYSVLRPVPGLEDEGAVQPVLLTAAPFEAEAYMIGGDEIVEAVPMPPEVVAWVQAFVERHHVDVPFVKRQRDRAGGPAGRFGGGDV